MGRAPSDELDDAQAAAGDDTSADPRYATYFDDALHGDDAEDEPDEGRRRAARRVARGPRVRWRLQWAAYAASFVLPLTIVLALGLALLPSETDAGDTALTEQTAPNPSPTARETWPPGVSFAEHSVPAYIRDELGALSARGYLFEGEAGDTWRVEVTPIRDGGLAPQVTLYDSDGVVVQQDAAPSSGAVAELVLTLPQRGRYGLVVAGTSAGRTGTYLLTLFPQ